MTTLAAAHAPLGQLGRYRILKELGRGAMGVVYLATDPVLARTVAIKTIVMPADVTERAEYEGRFLQEAKAAGGLNHPNIITVHDAGREGGVAYMAMEVLAGVELRQMMSQSRLPLSQALDIAAQIADGLAFAHESGVIHRDIKPTNIMIVRGSQVKIMDFGIARTRVSEVKTQTGVLLGSPKYMAPEQVIGSAIDHRSDIFALGVLLYEMATGSAPFSGGDIAQLMYRVVHTTPLPLSQVNPTVPALLDRIVARALAKEPSARYQTASELAADLRRCQAELASQPGAAASVGSTLRLNGETSGTLRLNVRPGKDVSDSAETNRTMHGAEAFAAAGPRVEGQYEKTVRVEPEPIETLRARLIGGGHAASNRVIPGKENWAWLGRYVLVMVIALVLGGIIGELDLFKQTGLGTHKLTASKLVRFLGYGGALLVLGLLSIRAARQFRDQGGKAGSFGSLIVPLATLIVVVSGDSVLRIVVNPFLHQSLRSAYDWLFVCGIIAAALWLAFAIFHQAEPIGGLFKSGIAERPAGAACTACGTELPASGKFCSTCGAAAS